VAHAAAQPAPPAAPPPLDLTAVEQAVMAATDSIDAVTAVDADDPARKKLLVGWYKKLAKVGEELAVLETIAADSWPAPDRGTRRGQRPLWTHRQVRRGSSMISKRLCRDWVRFEKRPANGVLLVAQIDDVKQVGPYWSSTVSLEMDDGSTKQVSVISRIEPKAAAGDRAVVAGSFSAMMSSGPPIAVRSRQRLPICSSRQVAAVGRGGCSMVVDAWTVAAITGRRPRRMPCHGRAGQSVAAGMRPAARAGRCPRSAPVGGGPRRGRVHRTVAAAGRCADQRQGMLRCPWPGDHPGALQQSA